MEYQYIVVRNVYQTKNGTRTSFGIAVVSEYDGCLTILESVSDLTPSFEQAEDFAKLCNAEKLEYTHFHDVIEDFLANSAVL